METVKSVLSLVILNFDTEVFMFIANVFPNIGFPDY